MIVPVGEWIFKQALKQCKEWTKKNPQFRISVNLSYLQIVKTDIISMVKETLQEFELAPDNLVLELTETYLIKAEEETLRILETLRALGVKIAMDDFGVGYSSLCSLKTIPVDIVKIDQEFARDIPNNMFNATFVRSITELCHDVGKEVCLEGVETEEEYNIVAPMGLELIQGFYFGRPVPEDKFREFYIKS